MDDETISRETLNHEETRLKVKVLDIVADVDVAILHINTAMKKGIRTTSKISIDSGKREVVSVVDTTHSLVKENEIGLFKNFADTHELKDNDLVVIKQLTPPKSLDYIKKKISNIELTESEILTIISDVIDNKLGEVEIAAFITALYAYPMTEAETLSIIKAMLATGKSLNLNVKPIADKHCIGGVAGNRTTMLIVPIVASAGIYIPKTSSRAITSASGTADTMEAIANVSFNIEEMEEIVKKAHGCIVWGGALNLAAADDKLIKIRHPLRLDPEGLLLASILAKKKSVNAQHLLVDIPVGTGAKIAELNIVQKLANKFKKLGNALGIDTAIVISDGSAPIGYGVGPVLECIDVLKILENAPDANVELKEKACMMAGKILELCGKANEGQGYLIAKNILSSGVAYKKFTEIVELQGGSKNIKSSDLSPAKYSAAFHARQSGSIIAIDNRIVSKAARIAGAPWDKDAGVFLYVKSGTKIKKNQAILEIYSNSETKLTEALEYLETNDVIITKSFVREI